MPIKYLTTDIRGEFRVSPVDFKAGLALEVIDAIPYVVPAAKEWYGDARDDSPTGLICHPVGHPGDRVLIGEELLWDADPTALCPLCLYPLGDAACMTDLALQSDGLWVHQFCIDHPEEAEVSRVERLAGGVISPA